MKRLLCMLLICVLTLSLCACGAKKTQTNTAEPEVFRVGFGRVNINGSGALPLSMLNGLAG